MGTHHYTIQDYVNLLESAELLTSHTIKDQDLDKEIRYLTYDSQDVEKGSLFVCKGSHFISAYLTDAIKKGAICYVSEETYQDELVKIPELIVSDIRKAMAILGNFFYGEAWRELTLVGITGTKGKSTTTYYVKSILDQFRETQGKPASAVVSGIDVDDGVLVFESHLTTPEAMMLHRHFRNAADTGKEYLTMEVSSQALKYDRTLGIRFTVGCFLNIGLDHISPIEHTDFDDYFEAKCKLMEQCEIACVNINSDHAEEVCQAASCAAKLITFGTEERADIYGHRIRKEEDRIAFLVQTPSYTKEFHLSMAGLFNVENALAAIAICYGLEIPVESIYEGLLSAKVAGRMETFLGNESNTLVIVDYAHNRMSFERLFTSTIREYPNRKILAVFGCPGKKALARRQELPEIAGRYAKKLFFTEEDAGEESVRDISEEMGRHARRTGCDFQIIDDREEAIRQAIAEADDQTVILLTGKGRETRQKRGTQYVDCPSDVDYVLKYLK